MRTEKIAILILLVILGVNSACSQKIGDKQVSRQPDFAGTWNFDISRSRLSELGEEVMKDKLANLKNYSYQLIIEQDFPVIKMGLKEKYDGSETYEKYFSEHPEIGTQTYYVDGRGENEPIDTSIATIQTVAKIVGEKLVITKYSHVGANKKKVDFIREFRLSEDGNTLFVETKFIPAEPPENAAEEKENDAVLNAYDVFNRAK